jgi:hypothetical protein
MNTDFQSKTGEIAISIHLAQRLRGVSTGILPSNVAVMETKTLNHRGLRGKPWHASGVLTSESEINPKSVIFVHQVPRYS